jgi:Flp pilus assembly protein TadD
MSKVFCAALLAACVAFSTYAMASEICGWDAFLKNDHGRAIADYTQAIKLDPKDANAYFGRGLAYDSLGDYKSATKDARKACELGECDLLQILGKNKHIRD